MNIVVVGNVLKDIYLNLDTRTEHLERDKHNTWWLDISFNASEHRFFNRNSSLGGAAISLEVLSKMGIPATISGSHLHLSKEGLSQEPFPDAAHRYILIVDEHPSYFVPSKYKTTDFSPPSEPVDYVLVDRSAELTADASAKINAYLDISQNTKLILYVRNFENPNLNNLIPRATLVFSENTSKSPIKIDANKLISITNTTLSYKNYSENITVNKVDVFTHLSIYSIATATVLGSFILGNSIKDSLKLARINIENSRLDSVLSLAEIQEIAANAPSPDNLELIAANLVLKPKGILAADESGGSIKKKFAKLNIPDTYDNRRDYRNIFFTTPRLQDYVNGVILFDETSRQLADNGQNYVDFLTAHRVIPGIKVDEGLAKYDNSIETYTKGLNGLDKRLKDYRARGLRFAKWRAAFEIHLSTSGAIITPTTKAIEENCRILAEYASKCQLANIVPIVEPEVVYDGYYSIEQNAETTSRILDTLFAKLTDYKVNLRACILKVNMILAGKNFQKPSTPVEVGQTTAQILKEHVPAELAGVVFLSGGQTVEQATANLAEVEKSGPFPWPVAFSFARALQDPALYAWAGNNQNTDIARKAFLDRLIANTDALKNNP